MKNYATKHSEKTESIIFIAKNPSNYILLSTLLIVAVLFGIIFILNHIDINQQRDREMRIAAVYDSLELDNSYRIAKQDIFGDLRVNPNEEHGLASSVTEYGKNASRSSTFTDLEKHIKQAGFTKISNSDFDTTSRQDRYRNNKGESIRVSIETATVHNAALYGTSLPKPGSEEMIEKGPVYVTIKVNLDEIDKQSPLY